MNPPEKRPARAPLLTEVAHQWLRQAIAAHRSYAVADTATADGSSSEKEPPQSPAKKKLRAIDATAGNGHDTLFLANELGTCGQVAAFDIQLPALEQTAQRLRSAGISNVQMAVNGQQISNVQVIAGEQARVLLLHTSHANLTEALPQSWLGSVCAITFNLGYLPGGDKEIVTQPASTLQALENSLPLLAADGLLSVLCYRGHSEGAQETAAIEQWCQSTLPALGFCSRWINAGSNAPANAPILLHVFRAAQQERSESPQ